MAHLTDRLMGCLAAGVDQSLTSFFTALARRSSRRKPEALPEDEKLRLLGVIRQSYQEQVDARGPTTEFFEEPTAIQPELRPIRKLPQGGQVLDARWESRLEPFLPDMRESYLKHDANLWGHARFFFHDQPRPAVVLIHGYYVGHFPLEERIWPLKWLVRAGLDVAIVQLPFHGNRRPPNRRGAPIFPGADPRMTVEGFRHAIWDVRAVHRYLLQRGSPAVGAMGMSLGGATTALLSTVEPSLAFAVLVIPMSTVADFARDQGRLGQGDAMVRQHRALEEASALVSPFTRTSRIPSDRMLIIGAENDRITPIGHAERLSHHFAADLVRIPGSHLVQRGMAEGYRAAGRLWGRLGLLHPSYER
jgi:dienelactone hydrolase